MATLPWLKRATEERAARTESCLCEPWHKVQQWSSNWHGIAQLEHPDAAGADPIHENMVGGQHCAHLLSNLPPRHVGQSEALGAQLLQGEGSDNEMASSWRHPAPMQIVLSQNAAPGHVKSEPPAWAAVCWDPVDRPPQC